MPGKTLLEKILAAHGAGPLPAPGEPLSIPIDQTLTQDATGTMAFAQFEALGAPRVRTRLSVSYVDHNTLQTGFANADDHRFLRTAAARFGAVYSPPGNGICHQLHLERFARPGETLLGADSHTATAGGMGMLAMGAGGLDVALAMAGERFSVPGPRLVKVNLSGRLSPWVAAKDVILELLRRLSVKGGVGKVFEYAGPGVAGLSVPERATITNMGAELGATSSIFPSDAETRRFLAAQGRAEDFTPLEADPDAVYDEELALDLAEIAPLAARPHSPDNVVPVSELSGLKVDQVVIGSCTNSSYKDLATVAKILEGRKVHPETSLVVAPGSRQVLLMLAEKGLLRHFIEAGARIMECACGPCIGTGQAPGSAGITLRTVNRNFAGRSGTADAGVFLVSPETAAAAAVTGVFTDPRGLGEAPSIPMPEKFPRHDGLFIFPEADSCNVEILRGPNIKPLPLGRPIEDTIEGEVLISLSDNVTTDDIMPAGAHILQFRSNVPAISRYVFSRMDPGFAERAEKAGGGFIVAGENYGQGSSREHAALAPLHLGVRAVMALSFARIHRANLINFGILPLLFDDPADKNRIAAGDRLLIPDAGPRLLLEDALTVVNETRGARFSVRLDLNDEERRAAAAGGRLNLYRERAGAACAAPFS